jgi:hypothetical protein
MMVEDSERAQGSGRCAWSTVPRLGPCIACPQHGPRPSAVPAGRGLAHLGLKGALGSKDNPFIRWPTILRGAIRN